MHRCQYHSERSALWSCWPCARYYCSECIPGGERNFGGGEPCCPLCNTSLDYLGGGVEAEPFWQKGPDLLRYGLKAGPLTAAAVTALVYSIGGQGLLLLLLTYGFYLVLLSYALKITVRMARGSWEPPSFGQAFSDDLSLSWKQVGLVVLLFVIPFGVAVFVTPILGGLLFLLAMLALPAAIMLLALTESLFDAINPVMQWRLISAVGWPYLLLWFALSAVLTAPDLVALALGDSAGGFGVILLINFLAFYSLLVAYALMGYLLFQYGGELGIAAHQERGRSLSVQDYQRKAALGVSHIYAREGRIEDALDVVNRALGRQNQDMALHERKHRLLKSRKNLRELAHHGRDYCRILVAGGNPGSATSVLRDIWQQDPDFKLQDPVAGLAIARVFYEQGRFRDAKRLLVNLHRDYPQFDRLGEAYLLLGRIYLEGFDSREHVRRILGFLKQNRPDSLETDDGQYLRRMLKQTA